MVTPRPWATAPAAPSYPALVQAPNRIFHISLAFQIAPQNTFYLLWQAPTVRKSLQWLSTTW